MTQRPFPFVFAKGLRQGRTERGESYGPEMDANLERLDATVFHAFAPDLDNTHGLSLRLFGGAVPGPGGYAVLAADQSVTLTDNATNYVERDASGLARVSPVAHFSAGWAPLCIVTTRGGVVATITDSRMSAAAGTLHQDLLDPRDFGTMSDDPTFDNEPAIQAALDAAYANHHAGWTAGGTTHPDLDARSGVLIPQCGATLAWGVRAPLWLKGATSLVGSVVGTPTYESTTRIQSLAAGGYTIVSTSALDTVSRMLVTGQGGAGTYSYHVAADWSELGLGSFPSYPPPSYNHFDFRECCRRFDLHGLAQLCVEFTFKPNSHTIPDGYFLSSMGRWKSSEMAAANAGGAFRIQPYSDGVVCSITTTTGTYTSSIISPGTGIISGGVYHRIILDYDGAHMRVYIDTTLVDSVAVTGTIVQHDAEGVFFGRHFNQMPYQQELAGQTYGYYGTFKFSNVARYAGGTGASGEPAGVDANTLCIFDWTTTKGPMVRASTPDGLAWLLRRGIAPPESAAAANDSFVHDVYGPVVRDIVVTQATGSTWPLNNGYFFAASGGLRGRFEGCHVMNGARYGMTFGASNNAYGSTLRYSYNASWGGRYALIGSHNLGLATPIEGLWLSGSLVLAALSNGIVVRDTFFECGPIPTPVRDDGGQGTRHAVIFFGQDLVNTLTLDHCNFSTEAGAGDLEATVLVCHTGFGPTRLVAKSSEFEQFVSTIHALPGYGATQPFFLLDTPVKTKVYGDNFGGGASLSLDECGFHFWGNPRAVEDLILVTGDGPFLPSVIRNPRFAFVPPKRLCPTPGICTLEAPNAVQVLPCVAGAAVAYSAAVGATSAANASSLAFSLALPAGSDGFLMIVAQHIMTAGGGQIQGLLCGVAPFNVKNYPFADVATIPQTGLAYGDTATRVWATQDVPLGTTVDFQINMTGPVGAGVVITAMAVLVVNVVQGDAQEGYGVNFSRVAGSHTVHQDYYETLRPDCMVLDIIGGGPGAVPVADAGQTARVAVNTGSGIAYGASTKPIAAAARATTGWTLASTSVPSNHLSASLRPNVVTFDALKGKAFYCLLDKNVALSHLVHFYDGMELTVILKQDGVGGRTFAWPANVSGAPAPAGAAGAVTIVKLYSDGAGGAYAK